MRFDNLIDTATGKPVEVEGECKRMSPEQIKAMVDRIHKNLGIPDTGPMDKTGMRPDQVAFWESVERGDHLTSKYLGSTTLGPSSDDDL